MGLMILPSPLLQRFLVDIFCALRRETTYVDTDDLPSSYRKVTSGFASGRNHGRLFYALQPDAVPDGARR